MLGNNDRIYLLNGVAYAESALKTAHLHILTSVIIALQEQIRARLFKPKKISDLPAGPIIIGHKTRQLVVPVHDMMRGNNQYGLRKNLQEMREIPFKFQDGTNAPCIAGFYFPPYAREVKIYLYEEFFRRLVYAEEGYWHFDLTVFRSLSSRYVIRLYWLVCSWRNAGGFVIPADKLLRILSATSSYARIDNLEGKILQPARDILLQTSPIWFQFRRYERDNKVLYAFKVKTTRSQKDEESLRHEKYDYCFNLLSWCGLHLPAIDEIFTKVETDDLPIFIDKIDEIRNYIASHDIRNREAYLHSALQKWFDNWLDRYGIDSSEK